ncbi:MAG: hypothetical protein KC457_27795, partial [Myxococcales bacterium]|nr:hypothetical protein [Myxococcales bacterium]
LSVFPVVLPPLRARREDIVPLAQRLLRRIAGELGRPGLRLSPGAHAALEQAPWRGNVRELANTLERAAILADGDEVGASVLFALPGVASGGVGTNGASRESHGSHGSNGSNGYHRVNGANGSHAVHGTNGTNGKARSLSDLEREAIVFALGRNDGNRRKAAEELGIGLRTLYDKLKRYELS